MRTATKIGLAALGIAAGSTYVRYRRDLEAARRRVNAGSRIVGTDAGPIEFAERGSGAPALVIHGAGGGWDQGLLVGSAFPNGVRIIAPSRFGYLRTRLPEDASPPAQARAHVALLDALGVSRAIVAGISAGAPSAIELAIRHPDRVSALILLVPRGYAPGHSVEVPRNASNDLVMRLVLSGADLAYWLALRFARSRIVQFVGVSPALEGRAPAAERARVERILWSIFPLSMRTAGVVAEGPRVEPAPLERIAAPTLIVTARDDLFETLPAAEYMAARIPGARLVVLEDGGHLFVGRQAELERSLAAFLAAQKLLDGGETGYE